MKTILTILIVAIGGLGQGSISTNVPLNHWSYSVIDKLVGEGLIDSGMLGTKPFSRLEMARLIHEATEKAAGQDKKNRIIPALLDRLQQEFKPELNQMDSSRMGVSDNYVKPVEDPYIRLVYGRDPFGLENESGDLFDKGSNTRLGFAGRMNLYDRFAFYVHPEHRSPSMDDTGIEVIEGYGKTHLGSWEIELGKDSLWWGPGYHGSLLMSNNAENFGMFKISNPEPIQLPWLFKRLGPFKAVYFLTRLEGDRMDSPHARLTGIRLSAKPHPWIEIGGSRTIQFGGKAEPDIGVKDYLQIFWPKNLQDNENQLGSLDASVLLPLPKGVPARSLKAYVDWAGEDAAGFSKYVPLFGLQINDLLMTGRTDLRIEYGTTHVSGFPNVFYSHHFYTSGYTYHGRMIGHHMGTDAKDLFVRLTHYLTPDMVLGLDYDRQQTNLSGSSQPITNQFGADLMWFAPHNWQLQAAYRFQETTSNDVFLGNNHILDLTLIYNF